MGAGGSGGGCPTCGGLGAVGRQLQRLEDVAAELEEVGSCGRGRGRWGDLAPPPSQPVPVSPRCPPGLTLEEDEDEGHGLPRGGPDRAPRPPLCRSRLVLLDRVLRALRWGGMGCGGGRVGVPLSLLSPGSVSCCPMSYGPSITPSPHHSIHPSPSIRPSLRPSIFVPPSLYPSLPLSPMPPQPPLPPGPPSPPPAAPLPTGEPSRRKRGATGEGCVGTMCRCQQRRRHTSPARGWRWKRQPQRDPYSHVSAPAAASGLCCGDTGHAGDSGAGGQRGVA